MGKVSVKCIELRCRAVLNEYRVQANKLKQQQKFLPFYPKADFNTQKQVRKRFLTSQTKTSVNFNGLIVDYRLSAFEQLDPDALRGRGFHSILTEGRVNNFFC